MSRRLVLVTGGSGYLAILLAERHLARGDEVVLSVRGDAGRRRAEAGLGRLAGRVGFVPVDLGGPDPFGAVDGARRGRITSVVHAAAVTRFNVDRETARQVNVEGTRSALALARSCPALESFGYVSTVYSSGLLDGKVPEERHDSAAGFANSYEWSKWAAEEVVFEEAGDVPAQVMRLATVVADDVTGRVTQYNAFHETLKLWFYGLLSLLPGRGDTPLYFVTGDFAADAVIRLMDAGCGSGVYHVSPDRSAALTLDQVLDVALDRFNKAEAFRRKRIPRPLLADAESFGLLVEGVNPFAGAMVAQALANVAPFAAQLYVDKEIDNRRMRAALPDYRAPDPAELLRATCDRLVEGRWGRADVVA